MSQTTSFLSLLLPLNGEYVDTWDEPMNANLTKIDEWAQDIGQEIADARFGEVSLKAFLETSHNADGSLIPTTEVLNSRSSFLYGDESPSAVNFDLAARLFQSDKDVFYAREGASDLRSSLATRLSKASKVLEGSQDANGYPTWLGYTGVNVNLDGATQNILLLISGKVGRIRKLEIVPVSGAVGTKYLYAQFNPTGLIRVDGDSTTAPPVSPNGTCSTDGLKVRLFVDTTVDFTTQDVKAGDVLEILGNGPNAGMYQIAEVAPGGNNNSLKIYGVFPGGALTALNYTISDAFAVTLGYDIAPTPAEGKFYIGEADFDGSSVTAVRAIMFGDMFVSEWRSVDVSGSPTFTEIWNHTLFDDALDIEIQVSQNNDGTTPIEILSKSSMINTLTLNNGLTISAGDQTLGGSITLAGTVQDGRSVKMNFTKTQVTVSNVTASLFYKDFSGASQTGGFVRVVVKKLRK